ncbi:MAG: 5-formyltetrahydrofolate cyclo-ligase [Prosthecobacter sp.]
MAGSDESWTKAGVRRSMRALLRAVPESTLAAWSAQLVTRLQAWTEFWEKPGTAAIFGGLRSEPDLVSAFLPWLRERGWRVVFFTVSGTELLPVEVRDEHDLKRGPLGVWEPVGSEVLPLAALDVILVPGLAFAQSNGVRLGRGGGFYDRLLSRPEVIRARRIGIAFQMQLLPDIPCEEHDVRVNDIVTER